MKKLTAAFLILALIFSLAACSPPREEKSVISLSDLPAYSGEPYIEINGNVPSFTENDITTVSYEFYSELDHLDRCGYAEACIGLELMPTGERGSIGQVKPSGWQTVKYDIVDGKYLYNRCHLIGYQLSGENANEKNLITGTRYLNVEGMLPFENLIADYVKETGNHVLYRVTPVFNGENLLASGVVMEALSVEDGGEGVCFAVFAYNVQPGIEIDYANGDSALAPLEGEAMSYVLNTSSKKFHFPDCPSVEDISENNRQDYTGSRESLTAQGYSPCGRCKP